MLRCPPVGALLANQLCSGSTQPDAGARLDALEHLIGRWPGDLSLEDVLDVPRQRHAPTLGPPGKFAMQSIGYVPDLDHRHASSMSHVPHMVNAVSLPDATRLRRGVGHDDHVYLHAQAKAEICHSSAP